MVVFLMLKQRNLLFRSESNAGDLLGEGAGGGGSNSSSPDREGGKEGATTVTRGRSFSHSNSNLSREGANSETESKHKRLLDPELQLSYGVSAAKTILSQAGFQRGRTSSGRQRIFLDVEDDSDDDDDEGEDWDDIGDSIFGFTFFIQHQEYGGGGSDSDDDDDDDESGSDDDFGEKALLKPPHDNDDSCSDASESDARSGSAAVNTSAASAGAEKKDKNPILWGQLLLDFFQFFGDDFDVSKEGFSVRGGGFSFPLHGTPPHPLANDPLVIEDPLNATNNVGRSNYRISQLQAVLSESLLMTKSSIARHDRRRSVTEIGAEGAGAAAGGNLLRNLLSLNHNYEHIERKRVRISHSATTAVAAAAAKAGRGKSKEGAEEGDSSYRNMLTATLPGERRTSVTSVKDDKAWIL
jgi:hypothetical protein